MLHDTWLGVGYASLRVRDRCEMSDGLFVAGRIEKMLEVQVHFMFLTCARAEVGSRTQPDSADEIP